jgi:hypothetical protein
MSAFYDQASLVVVPSGYKSGKIYAQKPLTTDGQLTFTRASTATRVNASGLIETVASGVPRLDYLGSSCPKLQLEPQRSNIVTQSESFDNAAWTKYNSSTVTANTVISPDGTQNADTLTVSTTVYSGLYQPISGAAGNYVVSIFAKKGTKNWLYMFDHSAAGQAWFNLDTGTVGSVNAGYTATITAYGNGWFRCTMYRNSGGTPGYFQIGLSDADGVSTPTSTGTAHIWGAMLEAGFYGTSYVKTEAAAVTRLADTASKTGISSLIGQTEGTLFTEFTYNGTAVTTFAERIIAVGDGTANNRIVLLKNPSLGTLYLFVSSGINQTSIAGTSIIGGTHKVAIAYKSGDYAVYFDGASVFTSNATGVPTLSAFFLGTNEAGTIEPLGGTVSQALLFKTRLTNAQLAEITTL